MARVRIVEALTLVLAFALLVIAVRGTIDAVVPVTSSDGIYPYVLATDSEPLHSWHISPSPCFADLAAVYLLTRVLPSLRAVYDWYGALFAIALVVAAYRAHRALGLPRTRAGSSAMLGAAAVYGAQHVLTRTREALVMPAFHGTSLLLTLIGFAVLVDPRTRRRRPLVAVGALIGLFGCGDTLLITELLLPIFLLVVLAGVGVGLAQSFIREALCFSGAVLLGYAVGRVGCGFVAPVPQRFYEVGGMQVLKSLANIWTMSTGEPVAHEGQNPGFVILSVLFLVAALVLVGRELRRRQAISDAAVGVLLALLVVVSGAVVPVVLGQHAVVVVFRYALPALVLPALLCTLPLRLLTPRRETYSRAGFLALAAFAALYFGFRSPERAPADFDGAGLDGVVTDRVRQLAEQGVTRGFAGYWDAKVLAVHAGRGVRCSTLDVDHVTWWLSSDEWLFEPDPRTGELVYPARFFVYEHDAHDLPRGAPERAFGVPESIEIVGRGRLFVFRFDARRYGHLVRDLCGDVARDGHLCAPSRGLVDVLPLLEDNGSVAEGLDLTLPNGRYALRLDSSGPATIEARIGSESVTAESFAVTTGNLFAAAEPLHVVIKRDAAVTLRGLRLVPLP